VPDSVESRRKLGSALRRARTDGALTTFTALLATVAAVMFALDFARMASALAVLAIVSLSVLIRRLLGLLRRFERTGARAAERNERALRKLGAARTGNATQPREVEGGILAAVETVERRLVAAFGRSERESRLIQARVRDLRAGVDELATDVGRLRASLDERTSGTLRRVERIEVRGERIERAVAEVSSQVAREAKVTRFAVHTVPQDVEASNQLRELIKPTTVLPPTGGWAVDARTLLVIAQTIRRRKPRYVVELGSGTSTVWLGYLLREYGGRLLSIEGQEAYASIVRDAVEEHELQSTVDLRVVPLADIEVEGAVWRWYADVPTHVSAPIDLLLIDGPPKATGPLARFPALPVLRHKLAPDAVIALDDASRPEEDEIMRRWLDSTPGLVRLTSSADDLGLLHLRDE